MKLLLLPTLCSLFGLASFGCQGESDATSNTSTGNPPLSDMDTVRLPDGAVIPAGDMSTPGDQGGTGDGGGGTSDGGGTGDPLNQTVFQRLKHNCEGCHGQGTPWPAFDSVASFENLLVYNPTWITLGDAETSPLFPMLGGRGPSGGLQQMPVGGATFEELEAQSKTKITVQELKDWVNQLKPRGQGSVLPPPTIRFKRAEQIVAALYGQLGLEPKDFFNEVSATEQSRPRQGRYPVAIPDAVSVRYDNSGLAFGRWSALGGGSHINQSVATQTPTIARAMALTQMSQSWCRLAVQKSEDNAVLKFAAIATTSDTGALDIKKNIDYLHLRMLGEPITPARQQELYEMFTHYEAREGGTVTAWTSICSALIRDPLWITY